MNDARARCEDWIGRFEAAFRNGARPALEQFLPADAAERQMVLVELAHAELELRLKAGEPARADEYLARFPELARDPEIARELHAAEDRFRPSDVTELIASAKSHGEARQLDGYRLLHLLGAGGMGEVFLAQDVRLGRSVALKVMRQALAANTTARQRFLREARAMAALKHPHIVTIYQVGEADGTPFLAMEFLEGETLAARLQRVNRLPNEEVACIGRQIAEALTAAHAAGLIHRDITPANVFLERARQAADVDAQAQVKILDFGLARNTFDTTEVTQSGVVVGTPAYMAPEQAQSRPLDARCDLFSLGAVLYHCATGRLPFQRSDGISILHAIATKKPVPPRQLRPDLAPELADFIVQLLAKSPAARPSSAGAVAARLRAIEVSSRLVNQAATTSALLPPPAVSRIAAISRSHWLRWAMLGTVVLLLVLLVAVVWHLNPVGWTSLGAEEKEGKEVAARQPHGPLGEHEGRNAGAKPGGEPKQVPKPDPPPKPVLPDRNVSRAAALRALALGGRVSIWYDKEMHVVADAAALPPADFRLEIIDLHGQVVHDSGLAFVTGLADLEMLRIGGTRITDAGLAHLTGLPQLARLSLSYNSISDEGLLHLKGLGQLSSLDLSYTKVNGSGLRFLKHLPRLRTLKLNGNANVTDHAVASLKELASLQTLELNDTKFTAEGVAQLGKALPNCRIMSAFAAKAGPP